eukprot:14644263-Alexandrium_andersonii.AAC.1
MSASLVGSEMCIRDRVAMVITMKETRGMMMLRWVIAVVVSMTVVMMNRPCLLYTSDAADDM